METNKIKLNCAICDKVIYRHPSHIKSKNVFCSRKHKEKDIILDPFMGSGTTAIASRKLSRKFIGFELSKEYHKIAEARIKEELAQRKLFEIWIVFTVIIIKLNLILKEVKIVIEDNV